MSMSIAAVAAIALIAISASTARAQDRDTKVRADRLKINELGGWIYNDFNAGVRAAEAEGKPLLVVFRCIPCEACHEFDDEVACRDPKVGDLMSEFVCVRIVQCNALDLSIFQHDFDQSFAMTFMNADGTIYGRFGTRSNRDDESHDISLEGLRETLEKTLELHARFGAVRASLMGKAVVGSRFKTPLDYPSLKDRYKPELNDAEGQIARSCVHCHQVGEAERRFFRDQNQFIPDDVLFPYPNPTLLGLSMDPKHRSTVKSVAAGSQAEVAGIKPGDQLDSLEGQPIISTADIQWILQQGSNRGTLLAQVNRQGRPIEIELALGSGWRRKADISWRATTWDLRRMALGGMVLGPVSESERERLKLPLATMALVVEHLGEHGDHAVAKNAGLQKGDVLVAFDKRNDFNSETDVIAYAVQQKKPGDRVAVTFRRKEQQLEAVITLQ
jgi:hypothetical protein